MSKKTLRSQVKKSGRQVRPTRPPGYNCLANKPLQLIPPIHTVTSWMHPTAFLITLYMTGLRATRRLKLED